jgi:oligosaccharide translocation protein RFT1
MSLLLFHLVFVTLAIMVPNLGALSYAIARLIYALLFVLLNFYFILHKHNKEIESKLDIKMSFSNLLPDIYIKQSIHLDLEYLNLVKLYYTQSIYKQILTEGERYLITAFDLLTFSESGIYDIINNLGSLIARFIFLPIEDASYIYFTNSIERGHVYKSKITQINNNGLSAKISFENLLKLVSLIGVFVLCFGQSYAKLLLQIYGGDKLGKNILCINMLKLHCVYVYLLAVNGVTESFFNATMSQQQLDKHNKRLVLFSVIFLFVAFLFSRLFSIYGFLLANCVNMMIRISYSSIHIRSVFSGFKYESECFISDDQIYDIFKCFMPDNVVSLMLLVALIGTQLSEIYLFEMFKIAHFMIGALVFLFTLFIVYKRERYLKDFILKFFKSAKIN